MDMQDIKTRRKQLGLTQEDVASWLDIRRTTYTKKELGEIPTTIKEYEVIWKRLDSAEADILKRREVNASCLNCIPSDEKRQEVIKMIEKIYRSDNDEAVRSFEAGLKGVVSMIGDQTVMNQILLRLSKIEQMLEAEAPDENAAVRESRQGTAAVKLSNSQG